MCNVPLPVPALPLDGNDVLQIHPMEFLMAVSRTLDLFHPKLVDHHLKVTAISHSLAENLSLDATSHTALLVAAALHDVGALSEQERLAALSFDLADSDSHALAGGELLALFPLFVEPAAIVRDHHRPFDGASDGVPSVPGAAHILALADRIAILLDNTLSLAENARDIRRAIDESAPGRFHPTVLDAFHLSAEDRRFWRMLRSPSLLEDLQSEVRPLPLAFEGANVVAMGQFFSHIVDFQSPFTATHSAGVASVAERLSTLMDFPAGDRSLMRTAGFLHDLGKLAIPEHIIEKPGALTQAEISVMRSHPTHTRTCLSAVGGFEKVTAWAANHHERLDGSGYPNGYTATDLDLGSRVMAVADIFTACAEERPYRSGLPLERVSGILDDLVSHKKLDGDVVATLVEHMDSVDIDRRTAQAEASRTYETFRARTAT